MEKSRFRKALVIFKDMPAGVLEEIDAGYRFTYDSEYIKENGSISLSLPIQGKTFESPTLFHFFKGLLPEGWYLDIVLKKLKIDRSDLFGMLLNTCADTIGAVSIKEIR